MKREPEGLREEWRKVEHPTVETATGELVWRLISSDLPPKAFGASGFELIFKPRRLGEVVQPNR